MEKSLSDRTFQRALLQGTSAPECQGFLQIQTSTFVTESVWCREQDFGNLNCTFKTWKNSLSKHLKVVVWTILGCRSDSSPCTTFQTGLWQVQRQVLWLWQNRAWHMLTKQTSQVVTQLAFWEDKKTPATCAPFKMVGTDWQKISI